MPHRLWIGIFGHESLAFRSEENLSGSFTELKAEVIPVLIFVVIDTSLDLFSDLDTIVNNIASNMPGERNRVFKGQGDLLELLPVLLEATTVLHGALNLLNGIGNILNTINDVSDVLLLKMLVS